MANGFTPYGDGFVKIKAKLDGLQRQFSQSATLEVGWDDRATYPDGTPVGKIARVQEYGAVINHPGGTRYITDAVVKKRGRLMVTTRFVGPSFQGDTLTTGAHKIVIPPRPFIRPTVMQHQTEWNAFIKKQLEAGVNIEDALERLGMMIVGQIQQAIRNVQKPPLAAATIRRRAKKGFSDGGTLTKPLIDTGQMLRTVRAQVITGAQMPPPTPAPMPAPEAPPQPETSIPQPKSIWRKVVDAGKRLINSGKRLFRR